MRGDNAFLWMEKPGRETQSGRSCGIEDVSGSGDPAEVSVE